MNKKERRHLAEVLNKAIDEAGGPTEVARFISRHFETISVQAVSNWEVCPPRRAAHLEAAVRAKGGATTARDLCPYLFVPLAA